MRGAWQVRLVTVDHGLRSASALDAAFVQRLGAWLGVPVDRRTLALSAGAAVDGERDYVLALTSG